jgi:nucleotide-binding universal stress UspA family protein
VTLVVAISDVSSDGELIASARGLAKAIGWQVLNVNVRVNEAAVLCESAVNRDLLPLAGQPPEDLLDLVAQVDAGCVAMSMRMVGASTLGHPAEELLKDRSVPLLLVRPGMRPITGLQRLVVPLEGTPSTCAAIDFADEKLCKAGCEIVMLRCVSSMVPTETGGMPAPPFIDQAQYDWSDWQEEFRIRFSQHAKGSPHRVIVRVGEPTAIVAEEASSTEADLIALCSRGRCGRIARGLLQIAPCPLLIVPEST